MPMFLAHGEDDQIVPIKDATLKVYPGAPHGIAGPYQQALDKDLLEFFQS